MTWTGDLITSSQNSYRWTVFKVNPVATTIMCALSPFQKFYKVSLIKIIWSVFIAYTARCTTILKISQRIFCITDWYYLQSRGIRSRWSIDNSCWASRLKWWCKIRFFPWDLSFWKFISISYSRFTFVGYTASLLVDWFRLLAVLFPLMCLYLNGTIFSINRWTKALSRLFWDGLWLSTFWSPGPTSD